MASVDLASDTVLLGRKRKLPVLRQTEAAECGLACVAMVSWFWGRRVDVSTIRQRFSLSSRGMNLAAMIKIADALGLSSRAVRIEVDDLAQLRLPAVLHWEFKHFVVLKALGRRIVIHDPRIGIRKLTRDELTSKFTGVALELWPSSEFVALQEAKPTSWRELMGRPQGVFALFAKLFCIGVATELIALLLPIVTQWGIDNVAASGDLDLLTVLAISLGIMIALQSILVGLRGWSITSATTSFILHWKMHIFGHMTTLPMNYFQLRRVGAITSRYDSVERIIGILNDSFVEGVLDSCMGLATILVLFIYNIPLTLITLTGAVIYTVLRVIRYSTVRDMTQQSLVADAKENSCLIETIRGIRPIKLFARERGREQEWVTAAVEEANSVLALNQTQVAFKLLASLIGGTEQVIVFWFSLRMVSQGRMTIGMLVAFTAYRSQFYNSVSGLVDNYVSLQTVKLHAERVADIVLAEPEEARTPSDDGEVTERIGRLASHIELENVSFKYGEFESFSLKDLSLRFDVGENVAIVGKSGCGKSSLLSLLVGLTTPSDGRILFGGIPLKALGLATVRRHIGVVMQDDILFSGSIAQNIAAFDANIDLTMVAECARYVGIHDEILQMPMGYGTLVTDLGGSLSGGQRQRVCIARALYKRPKVLIMDEATSHLDVETETLINVNIKRMGITRILVAHRIDTVRSADRLILLDAGRVLADTKSEGDYEGIIKRISGVKPGLDVIANQTASPGNHAGHPS